MTDIEKTWKALADGWRHQALLFMALFVSGPADTMYQDYVYSQIPRKRRLATAGRARAVVLFDRVLNNEPRALKGVTGYD